ncbi:MAG: hypothetical protein HXX81_07560, partial [Campylobacterales bacterium]|nr:hypothetical protein [Campylobacterales bacterium]
EGFNEGVSIDKNGIIYMHFSNDKVEPFGRVGLSRFINDQGLAKVGSNLFSVTPSLNGETSPYKSGIPTLLWEHKEGTDTVGRLDLFSGSAIKQKMLETSNVDMATALTEIMVMQRSYSANAKSITTADDLIKEAIGLKR